MKIFNDFSAKKEHDHRWCRNDNFMMSWHDEISHSTSLYDLMIFGSSRNIAWRKAVPRALLSCDNICNISFAKAPWGLQRFNTSWIFRENSKKSPNKNFWKKGKEKRITKKFTLAINNKVWRDLSLSQRCRETSEDSIFYQYLFFDLILPIFLWFTRWKICLFGWNRSKYWKGKKKGKNTHVDHEMLDHVQHDDDPSRCLVRMLSQHQKQPL